MKRTWIQKAGGKDLLIISEDGRFELTRTQADEIRLFDVDESATVTIRPTKREAIRYAESMVATGTDKSRLNSIRILNSAIEFVAGRGGELTPNDIKEIELIIEVVD